jgi:hypothetical protein
VPLFRTLRCRLGMHDWVWLCYRNAYGDERVERGACQACGAVLTDLPAWGVWVGTIRNDCDGWVISGDGAEAPAMRKGRDDV